MFETLTRNQRDRRVSAAASEQSLDKVNETP